MNYASKQININAAAQILEISTATVRNWIKSNYITAINKKGHILFDYEKVKKLKYNIEIGNVNRLSKRANKQIASRTFVPNEQLKNKENLLCVQQIVSYIQLNKLDINASLFCIALNIIIKRKYLLKSKLSDILKFNFNHFNSDLMKSEIQNWYNSLTDCNLNVVYETLLNIEIPIHDDLLGLLYQSLQIEGTKSKRGSYYTPIKIVDDIINDYATPKSTILDPCCGSGQFLLGASRMVKEPTHLFGFDIDPIAVKITKINLILQYGCEFSKTNILNLNTLNDLQENNPKQKFDLIITNPPWGSCLNCEEKEILKNLYPEINSYESFSFFIHKCLNLLNENGTLSFILPESILNVKAHKDIRKYILQYSSILKIKFLGKVFTNVFTSVIRLDLQKTIKKHNKIEITKNNQKYVVQQSRFYKNQGYLFDVNQTEYDYKIIKKIYKTSHTNLKNNADWALGIVTGDNEKHISCKHKKDYQEIITGKEVTKYKLSKTRCYLKFQPDKYQQVAPIDKYVVDEKLIYKFISKKLVFAYDNSKKLTLNSANIVIPRVDNYPLKVIMALFNSDIYQFIYQKKFSSIKILRSQLEQLPLPLWDKKTLKKIIVYVDLIMSKKSSDKELNNFIMDKFKLTEKEKKHIFNSIR